MCAQHCAEVFMKAEYPNLMPTEWLDHCTTPSCGSW